MAIMWLGRKPGLVIVAGLGGFLAVSARLNPVPGTEVRATTGAARLEGLIRVEQRRVTALSDSAQELRDRVDTSARAARPSPTGDSGLDAAQAGFGLVAMRGPGLVVTIDDSRLPESPSGNVNDLVVHSQDVQAIANGLWAAGAEALAVNGQRVVPTSALLCVGNTLLINGTVHSPPYRFLAIGAGLMERFVDDTLVERYRDDASRFGLGFEVRETEEVTVPAYRGTATVRYARPAS